MYREERASRPEDEFRTRHWLEFIPVEGWRCLRTQIAYPRCTGLSARGGIAVVGKCTTLAVAAGEKEKPRP